MGGINDLNPKGVPYRLQASTTGQTVGTVFSTILRYTTSLDPTPHMTESYELAPDAMSARMVLKKGIEFHSGRSFTTADVQWNLQKAAEKSQRSQVRQLAEAIRGAFPSFRSGFEQSQVRS
ncbi:ABC transporter substrate-binding protein, partial [Candidatus Entotheonella palauensis]|uniref:ABC transporter substrate-binding protein n=1 Tax=Candidatus Entotheonella palauensis TaxID=93172 RepID=UPI002118B743